MYLLPISITIVALLAMLAAVAMHIAMKWKTRGVVAETSSLKMRDEIDEYSQLLESERIHACIDRTRLHQYGTVLDVLRDAVIVVDAHGEVLHANRAADCLLSVPAAEACSRPLAEIVDDQQLISNITSAHGGIPAGGSSFELEILNNSETIYYEVRLHMIEGGAEQLPTIVAILRDMSQEKEVTRLKSEFVSKASHELRTPLSSIAAYIEMLVDEDAEDEAAKQEYYSVIAKETVRLQRMIDNLLDISQIEAGLMNIDRQQIDIGKLVDRAVTNIKPQSQAKEIDIHLQLASVNLLAKVDGDMVYQVVVNLLSNAIKYTPTGGRITIDVDTDNLTRSLHFSVSDTGLGIAPDQIDKVFEKFYRIENYKKVAQGTGLGLNLCRHIVETLHSGQIGLESKLGLGSRFWFTIPLGDSSMKSAA